MKTVRGHYWCTREEISVVSDTAIWTMKLQPGGADDDADPYNFCKTHEPPIVGIGWGLSQSYDSVEPALADHRDRDDHTDQHGNVKYSIRAFLEMASAGDLVWVNDGGEYALCRLESEWKQFPVDEDGPWVSTDVRNYRHVDWNQVPPEFVPGYVKRRFAVPTGHTMSQPSAGKTSGAIEYAERLCDHGADEIANSIDRTAVAERIAGADTSRLLDVLDPYETEDIVLHTLQSDGWHVVKSSTSHAQADIEAVLRRGGDDPKTAYVQVKSGEATVNEAKYETLSETATVFIYQRRPPDEGYSSAIEWMSPADLKEYVTDRPFVLTEPTAQKIATALG